MPANRACSAAGAQPVLFESPAGTRRPEAGDRPSVIQAVSADQHAILASIIALYTDGGFDVDVTYSIGAFYGKGVPEPRLKFDIAPQRPDVVPADCCALPLSDASVRSIVFDPPFLHSSGSASLMGQRFGSIRYQRDARALWEAAYREFARVLMPGGIVVHKLEDVIESGRYVPNQARAIVLAEAAGFVMLDVFVLLPGRRMVGWWATTGRGRSTRAAARATLSSTSLARGGGHGDCRSDGALPERARRAARRRSRPPAAGAPRAGCRGTAEAPAWQCPLGPCRAHRVVRGCRQSPAPARGWHRRYEP
jgi:hypothetical protein